MKNIKGQVSLTKTGILFVVIIFYSSLFVLIGYMNSYMNVDTSVTTNTQSEVNDASNTGLNSITGGTVADVSQVQTTGFWDFIGNIITGIGDIPLAINIILFGSLVTILTWITVSSLPTFNGGS